MKTNAFLMVVSSLLCVALMASATTRYVNLNNPTPVSPFTDWPTAATSIQDAVDAAVAGDVIWVTNGVYATGARAVYGMSNRVAVTRAITVQSVNGPGLTSIAGYQVPGTTNGPAAVRCAYLINGAVLAGFTLTNGATQTSGDDHQNSGGGVWCELATVVVSNCVLTGNSAYGYGGGAYYGTLINCALTTNSANYLGGGAYNATLNNCTLAGNSAVSGGGVFSGTLNNCTLTGNSADSGGGAFYGSLNNCTLTGNSANYEGGGTYSATLNNCTLTGNSAQYSGGASGNPYGTGSDSTLNNCIVYYNTAWSNGDNYSASTLNYELLLHHPVAQRQR